MHAYTIRTRRQILGRIRLLRSDIRSGLTGYTASEIVQAIKTAQRQLLGLRRGFTS